MPITFDFGEYSATKALRNALEQANYSGPMLGGLLKPQYNQQQMGLMRGLLADPQGRALVGQQLMSNAFPQPEKVDPKIQQYLQLLNSGIDPKLFGFTGPQPTSLAQNLEGAGYIPGTRDYQDAMMKAVMKPSVEIHQGGAKLPNDYMWDPNNSNSVIPIPGGPADPSVKRFMEDTKNLKESEAKFGRVQQSLDNYSNLINQYGTTIIPGPDKIKLKTSYQDLLLEMKELYNLGVLNGPDYEIMKSVIIDPTSPLAVSIETAYGKGALNEQLKIVQQKLNEAMNRANSIYGNKSQSGQASQKNSTQAPPPPPGQVIRKR